MYDLELFREEGFDYYYNTQIGMIIEFKNKALFIPNIYRYNFDSEEDMIKEMLRRFSEWIMYCIYTNDLEWWIAEKLGGAH